MCLVYIVVQQYMSKCEKFEKILLWVKFSITVQVEGVLTNFEDSNRLTRNSTSFSDYLDIFEKITLGKYFAPVKE